MLPEDTSAALADILSNLAKSHDPRSDTSFQGRIVANGSKATQIRLPGQDSATKRDLEREVSALASRIQLLEARATTNNDRNLPITPGEPGVPPSPFSSDSAVPSPRSQNAPPSQRQASLVSKEQRANWVANWLASKDSNSGNEAFSSTPLSDEHLSYIREHVNKQADQIQSQRDHIENLSDEITQQLKNQDIAFGHGIEDIGALKRELVKHQQANLAFQKALREIGNIITAVANGDLSKKVLIHAKEMDPEITVFKRTINKMVDQLQDFASQVTFLAKEVGTEGRLGGQADLPGVFGIWADLTESGKCPTKPCIF